MNKSLYKIMFLALVLTFGCTEDPEVDPKLNTIATVPADITSTSAILKGEVQIRGTKKIIEYGIELSENMIFSQPVTKAISGSPTLGIYQVEFTGLKSNTKYYYKAYVLINTARLYSQNILYFTTNP